MDSDGHRSTEATGKTKEDAGERRMKVTVNVDCTPEEARQFLGLPDLGPVHQAYVEKLQKAVSEGPSPELYAEMTKAWGPMSEAGMGLWRQMLDQLSGKSQN